VFNHRPPKSSTAKTAIEKHDIKQILGLPFLPQTAILKASLPILTSKSYNYTAKSEKWQEKPATLEKSFPRIAPNTVNYRFQWALEQLSLSKKCD
jgi:hypothetical protein